MFHLTCNLILITRNCSTKYKETSFKVTWIKHHVMTEFSYHGSLVLAGHGRPAKIPIYDQTSAQLKQMIWWLSPIVFDVSNWQISYGRYDFLCCIWLNPCHFCCYKLCSVPCTFLLWHFHVEAWQTALPPSKECVSILFVNLICYWYF